MWRSVVVFGCLISVGCASVREVNYEFRPPRTKEGRTCIDECRRTRESCGQEDSERLRRCEERMRYEQAQCEDAIYERKGREPEAGECALKSCTLKNEGCEKSYRECYTSCGGIVVEQEV